MDVELKDLRLFVVLADEQQFSSAATLAGVSQPTLTRSLARLEKAVGAKLVDRTTRSFALTVAGHRLRRDLGGILPALDESLRQVSAHPTLRLGLTWAPPAELVQRASHEFSETTGGRVEVVLREDRTAGVLGGHVDVSLVHGAPGRVPGVTVTEVLQEERVLAVARDHVLARRRSVRWEEVADHPLVVNTTSGTVGPGQWPPARRPRVAQRLRSSEEVLEAVAAGEGVTVLPQVARDRPHPSLRYLPLLDAPSGPLVLLRPEEGAHPLLARFEQALRRAVLRPPAPVRAARPTSRAVTRPGARTAAGGVRRPGTPRRP